MSQTQIEAGINIGVFNVKVTKKFDTPTLPEIFTIHEAANAAVSLSKEAPLTIIYDEALRGLLSATLDGFFKGVLLHEQEQQVEGEALLMELANFVKKNELPAVQRAEALHKIRRVYSELRKDDDITTVSDDKLLEIFSNPEFLSLGHCTTGRANSELRPIEDVPIEESFFIRLLDYYVSQFQKLIDKDNLPKTFAELNLKYPNEMKHFKKNLPSHFKFPNNFDGTSWEKQPNIFVEKFKKMKISKKLFNSWYKQYLNKKFN